MSFTLSNALWALRGSAVAGFVSKPFVSPEAENWRHPLGELGYSTAALISARCKIKVAEHVVAAREAANRWNAPILALDCLLSAAHRPEVEVFDCNGMVIKEGFADCLDFEYSPVSHVELQWCHIRTLNLGDANPVGVRLYQCMIEKLVGISNAKRLPDWINQCDVGEFDSLNTNAAIMRSSAPMPVRVLLTILRKLFIQRGRARKESTFFQGNRTQRN